MFDILKKLFKIFDKKSKLRLAAVQLLIIFSSVLEMLSLIALVPLLNVISQNSGFVDYSLVNYFFLKLGIINEIEQLKIYSIFILFFFFINTLILIFANLIIVRFSHTLSASFSNKLFSYFLSLKYKDFIKNAPDVYQKKIITDVDRSTKMIVTRALQMFSKIFTSALIIIALFNYNIKITLILAVTSSLVYIIIFLGLKKFITTNSKNISNYLKLRSQLVYQTFRSFKQIMLFNRQKNIYLNFSENNYDLAKKDSWLITIQMIPRFLFEFFAVLILVTTLLYYLSSSVSLDGNFLATIGIFGFATLKILPCFQNIYSSLVGIKGNAQTFYDIYYDLKKSNQIKEINFKRNDYKKRLFDQIDFIKLENINFRYETRDLFKDLNIEFGNQRVNYIVGDSGSGKSTLVDIISGISKPDNGKLIANNELIDVEKISEWYNSISYVTQFPYVLKDTIKNNVTFFSNKSEYFDELRFKKALEIAELNEFVNYFDDRENQLIEDDGQSISGGQRQRIGIARSIYRGGDVLILDEATNSLDSITESKILNNIEKSGYFKIILIISHRLSIIPEDKKIYFINNKGFVSFGFFKDLANKSDEVKKVYEKKL